MAEKVTIEFDKEQANVVDRLLLLAAAFVWEVEETEGFLPVEREELLSMVENLRRQIEPHCNQEKMTLHNHKRYIKFKLERAGIKLMEIESEKNDQEMADEHKI